MSRYLYSVDSNCKNCYKCIRYCPVKSIKFEDNMAHIMQEDCILCGKCYIICPQDAKKVEDDISPIKQLLSQNEKVIASIAPSFVAYFQDITFEEISIALKKLGFYDVQETAIGATIVKNEYDRLVNEKDHNITISSCCPTINLMIQKYYPSVLPYLAKVVSPMEAHCSSIKFIQPDAKTVFIGPCISKIFEAEKSPHVDGAITFSDLSKWLDTEEVNINSLENNKDYSCNGGKARYFPIAGGILKSMKCDNNEATYISIDGLEQCISAINDISKGNLKNCFIEMNACKGGCIGGPIIQQKENQPIKGYIAVNRSVKEEDFDVSEFSDIPLFKDYPFSNTGSTKPGASQLKDILKRMGKSTPENELNCGSCGYNTCKEKAVAIYQGKATYSMCLPFLKDKAESFSDNIITNTPNGIIVLSESLKVQQINQAACKIMNIPTSSAVLGESVVRILDPDAFLNMMDQGITLKQESLYLAEYEKYIEQTIIHDTSYHILICIMRDVTKDELAKERKERLNQETIETADNVVEKQMRLVQEIASLLGESVAETKIALTKMKESLTYE